MKLAHVGIATYNGQLYTVVYLSLFKNILLQTKQNQQYDIKYLRY